MNKMFEDTGVMKYNGDVEKKINGLGTFKPGQIIMYWNKKEKKKYEDSEYFDSNFKIARGKNDKFYHINKK